MCLDNNADAKRILLASAPADWRRQLGRRGITWLSTIQQDLKHHHLTLPEPADLAQYGATQLWVARQKRRRRQYCVHMVGNKQMNGCIDERTCWEHYATTCQSGLTEAQKLKHFEHLAWQSVEVWLVQTVRHSDKSKRAQSCTCMTVASFHFCCTAWNHYPLGTKNLLSSSNLLIMVRMCHNRRNIHASTDSSNFGARLFIFRSAWGSSWKLSSSNASKALRCRLFLADSSRTRRCWTSLIRPAMHSVTYNRTPRIAFVLQAAKIRVPSSATGVAIRAIMLKFDS